MGFLSRLFGARDPLLRLAQGADRRAFVRALGESDVTMLGALTHPGLPADGLTPEAVLAMTEEACKKLSDAEKIEPFTYGRDGRECLPVFRTSDRAQAFVGAYSKEKNRVFPFQVITLLGRSIVDPIAGCDRVILNDGSEDACELSSEDRKLFVEMWKRV